MKLSHVLFLALTGKTGTIPFRRAKAGIFSLGTDSPNCTTTKELVEAFRAARACAPRKRNSGVRLY